MRTSLIALIRYKYKDGPPTGVFTDSEGHHWWEFKNGAVKLGGAPAKGGKFRYAYHVALYVFAFFKQRVKAVLYV